MDVTFPRLKKILGDSGFARSCLLALARMHMQAEFEVVICRDEVGFKVIPQRWIIDCSIACSSWFL